MARGETRRIEIQERGDEVSVLVAEILPQDSFAGKRSLVTNMTSESQSHATEMSGFTDSHK
jgi:hypothetical protein